MKKEIKTESWPNGRISEKSLERLKAKYKIKETKNK